MRLFLSDAGFGEVINQDFRLDLQFPRQLVNPDLIRICHSPLFNSAGTRARAFLQLQSLANNEPLAKIPLRYFSAPSSDVPISSSRTSSVASSVASSTASASASASAGAASASCTASPSPAATSSVASWVASSTSAASSPSAAASSVATPSPSAETAASGAAVAAVSSASKYAATD